MRKSFIEYIFVRVGINLVGQGSVVSWGLRVNDPRDRCVCDYLFMAVSCHAYLSLFHDVILIEFLYVQNDLNHGVVMHEGYELTRSWRIVQLRIRKGFKSGNVSVEPLMVDS